MPGHKAVMMTPAQHDEYQLKAWKLSCEGATYRSIAETLDINPKTASELVNKQRELNRKRLEAEGFDALAQYISQQEEVIDEANRRLEAFKDNADSMVVPGLLQQKSQASERIARAFGIIVDRRKLDVAGSVPVEITVSFDRAGHQNLLDSPMKALPDVIDAEIVSES